MILSNSEIKKTFPSFMDYQIGSCSVDLRLDKIYILNKNQEGYLVNNDKIIPDYKELRPIEKPDSYSFKIQPKQTVTFKCLEKITMPSDKAGIIISRSTLFRSGLSLSTGFVDNGFKGYIYGSLTNNHSRPFYIGKGDRICQMITFEVKNPNKVYKGYYSDNND